MDNEILPRITQRVKTQTPVNISDSFQRCPGCFDWFYPHTYMIRTKRGGWLCCLRCAIALIDLDEGSERAIMVLRNILNYVGGER